MHRAEDAQVLPTTRLPTGFLSQTWSTPVHGLQQETARAFSGYHPYAEALLEMPQNPTLSVQIPVLLLCSSEKLIKLLYLYAFVSPCSKWG